MCGIGGIVHFKDQAIAPARLEAMLAQLHHRGPDGQGLVADGRCGLVHTRLSIIDPQRGKQPMSVEARGDQGPLTVIFNGEIYNHRDLRRRLEGLGHRFQTDHCDTEVLLHGYRAWGNKLPEYLEGMFAFALWDSRQGRLFLGRDRTGKKPLYIRAAPDELMFGSEVATLMAGLPAGTTPDVRPSAMLDFLTLGYTGLNSMLEGIEEIPPAHCVTVETTGHRQMHRYWRPPLPKGGDTPLDLITSTRQILAEAVQARLEADTPLGCFLSGGIDSSLVAALAHAVMADRGMPPLRTFSVAMPQVDYDESPYALAVARHLGTNHTQLSAVPGVSLLADLMQITSASGEPTADSSILPTYWLSQVTRQHVKVVLSGDGGDELFGGYDRYRATRLLAAHRYWLRCLPTGLLASANPRSQRTRLRRLINAARCRTRVLQYRSMIQLFTDEQLTAIWPAGRDLAAAAGADALPEWRDDPDPAQAAMRWDFQHYLPFDLLRKVDRASMAVGLEVRCPMLDGAVCSWAASLSAADLMLDGRLKGLLRAAATPFLPQAIIRRPKRGFAIPIGTWFRTKLRQMLRDEILDPCMGDLGFVHAQIVKMEAEHATGRADHSQRLFALLSLAVWNRWRKWQTRQHAPTPATV